MSRSLALGLLVGAVTSSWTASAQPSSLTTPPQPCEAVPASDTLMGTTGSAGCYTPPDAARPTVIQAANVLTGLSGTWSVAWAKPFASAAPVVIPVPVNTGTLPVVCNVTGRTATAATGRCWQATTTTISGLVGALLSVVANPFSAMAANVSVMVTAREPTQ